MKKTISLMLAVMSALILSAGCGAASSPEESPTAFAASKTDMDSIQTIVDIAEKRTGDFYERAVYDDRYVCVFEQDGIYYRATAALPSDTFDAMMDLDFADENYEQKYEALVGGLKIDQMENLSEKIPSQEELSSRYAGKTGEELLNLGWTITGYDIDEMVFFLEDDLFRYDVVFDGKPEKKEGFNEYEEIRPLTVRSITWSGISLSAA